MRLVAWECCNLGRRISVVLLDEYPPQWVRLPQDPTPNILAPKIGLADTDRFVFACTESTLRVRQEHPWCGKLDLQIYAQGFREGALWWMRIAGKLAESEQSQQE